MKNLKMIFSLTILLCAANIIAAQSSAPKTVEDFYMLLPAKYVLPLAEVKNRKQLIKTRDVANGYLRLENSPAAPDWEGWAEIALFKKTGGAYVVGVVNGECSTICSSGVEFLEYKNGKWTEVTAKIMPKLTDKMIFDRYKKIYPNSTDFDEQNPPFINYELPRKGTTVKLNANEGGDGDALLFELVWNGSRFEIKK